MAFDKNEEIADSRRITQFPCQRLPERFSLFFWRFRGDDFFEARIAAERIPEGQPF